MISFAIKDNINVTKQHGESKKDKALKDDALVDAINILRLLLEYYACKILNINISQQIAEKMLYPYSDEQD